MRRTDEGSENSSQAVQRWEDGFVKVAIAGEEGQHWVAARFVPPLGTRITAHKKQFIAGEQQLIDVVGYEWQIDERTPEPTDAVPNPEPLLVLELTLLAKRASAVKKGPHSAPPARKATRPDRGR